MGEPPRLSQILLPRGKAIIYFVTLCVEGRVNVLANDNVFDAIRRSVAQLKRWRLLSGVIMPDHVHFVVTPTEDRALPAGDFATGFKRLLRKRLIAQPWEWQRGCFDRLLRSEENLQSKWIYVEQNPVRACLVEAVADWPYYLGSLVEEGKLAASPTENVCEQGHVQ
jgi:REP element-mobilizing transposase RayT